MVVATVYDLCYFRNQAAVDLESRGKGAHDQESDSQADQDE
jgi:hypothetical protein